MRSKQSTPFAVLGFSIENIEYKSYPSIVLNLFDQLHPRYQREHSVGEIQRLFESSGFTRIEATNVVGMVEMRGVKERTATPAECRRATIARRDCSLPARADEQW